IHPESAFQPPRTGGSAMRHRAGLLWVGGSCVLLLLGAAMPVSGSVLSAEGVPRFGHLFLIIGENTTYSHLKMSNAPYLLGTIKPGIRVAQSVLWGHSLVRGELRRADLRPVHEVRAARLWRGLPSERRQPLPPDRPHGEDVDDMARGRDSPLRHWVGDDTLAPATLPARAYV